jgi:ketosteroid isomerase-like protein
VSKDHPAFNENAKPFYEIIMDGLNGEVDGDHFFDAIAEDAIFDFVYTFPGFTKRIEGRKAYMEWFGGYSVKLHSADGLRVYKASQPHNVVILEYAVHGTVPSTGKAYDNHFCSIITIQNRKIACWRDYMDGIAALSSVTPD